MPFPNFKVMKMPLKIGDKDLTGGLEPPKYITIKRKDFQMENQNKLEIKKGESTLQNTVNQITFDKLNEIDANELGRREIKTIVKKMKQSINDGLDAYLHAGKRNCLPLHIDLQQLDELLTDTRVDKDEIIDELSNLAIIVIIFNLSRYYKNSLLSSNRNDHHSYMLAAVNSFANKLYYRMEDGLEFHITCANCIMDYEMNFLMYWLEVATKEQWTI